MNTVNTNSTHPTPRPDGFIERSTLRGFLALTRDWGAYFTLVTLAVVVDKPWFTLLCLWPIGLVQFVIGETLLHEASHWNLFKSRKLNDRLDFLYALPFFTTITTYRREHLAHHRELNKGDDHLQVDYDEWGLNTSKRGIFWLWWVKPSLGHSGWHTIKSVVLDNNAREWTKILAFWTPVISLAAWAGALDLLLVYWFVPFLWCQSTMMYWSEVEDHYRTNSGTRTNIGRLYNRLFHNNGYHHVHHDYPTIPWYRLHEAHQVLAPDTADISSGFLDSYRQIAAPHDPTPVQEPLKPASESKENLCYSEDTSIDDLEAYQDTPLLFEIPDIDHAIESHEHEETLCPV